MSIADKFKSSPFFNCPGCLSIGMVDVTASLTDKLFTIAVSLADMTASGAFLAGMFGIHGKHRFARLSAKPANFLEQPTPGSITDGAV